MTRAFVYVTDQLGFDLARHSAVSVALSQHDPCDVHIFCHQFTPQASPELLASMARLGARLVFHPVSDVAVERHETRGRLTKASLLKLAAITKMVGQYDRIVYLDNDVLVFDDLRIENIEFGLTPLAAVVDMDLSDTGALRDSVWASASGKAGSPGKYFNSGVMIIASENWRHEEYQRDYIAALDKHDYACPHKINCTTNEQCALNSVFENRWTRLPLSYNLQASAKFTPAWQTSLIRHYCGGRKAIPLSLCRNDRRDVVYLNIIRRVLKESTTRFSLVYELLYQLNCLRNHSSGMPILRYMRAAQTDKSERDGAWQSA